jgi:hypothetical protein
LSLFQSMSISLSSFIALSFAYVFFRLRCACLSFVVIFCPLYLSVVIFCPLFLYVVTLLPSPCICLVLSFPCLLSLLVFFCFSRLCVSCLVCVCVMSVPSARGICRRNTGNRSCLCLLSICVHTIVPSAPVRGASWIRGKRDQWTLPPPPPIPRIPTNLRKKGSHFFALKLLPLL